MFCAVKALPAFVVDIVAITVFAILGRPSHEEANTLLGVLGTAWPFLVGALIGHAVCWLAAHLRGDPTAGAPGWSVWAGTLLVGVVLRVTSGDTAAWSFSRGEHRPRPLPPRLAPSVPRGPARPHPRHDPGLSRAPRRSTLAREVTQASRTAARRDASAGARSSSAQLDERRGLERAAQRSAYRVLPGVGDGVDGAARVAALLGADQGPDEDDPLALLAADLGPVVGVGGVGQVLVLGELVQAGLQQVADPHAP